MLYISWWTSISRNPLAISWRYRRQAVTNSRRIVFERTPRSETTRPQPNPHACSRPKITRILLLNYPWVPWGLMAPLHCPGHVLCGGGDQVSLFLMPSSVPRSKPSRAAVIYTPLPPDALLCCWMNASITPRGRFVLFDCAEASRL